MGLENIPPKLVVVVMEEVVVVLLPSSPVEGGADVLLSADLVEAELGWGDMQHTHLESDALFCTRQTSQLHPAGGLNKSLNPAEEDREEEVEEAEEEVAVDCVDVCCEVTSGPEEV